MHQRGRVEELRSMAGALPAAEPPSVTAVLSRSFAELRADVEAHRLCATPEERQDRLRSAISQLVGALAHAGSDEQPVQVLDIDTPAKPKVGPRPPAVIHLAAGGLRRRLAFDVNGDRSAYHTLERVRARVLQGEADVGVVFRERSLALGESAKRTLEIVRSLEPLGGIAYLDEATVDALLAADLLLDSIAGHDLALGSRTLERGDALDYLLVSEGLATAFLPVLEQALRSGPARTRTTAVASLRRGDHR
jgi:hypothetical protein